MIKTAVVGATGYSGLELIRILLAHPQVELTVITSRSQPDTAITEIFPALKHQTDLVTETFSAEAIADRADMVFTALPHGTSMDVVASLVAHNLKVIDLSADFRFRNQKLYQEWYGEHQAPLLLAKSVYGLPELNRAAIASATLVGNPGCYPTSAILPLLPLLKKKMIDEQTIIINSASGVTGAGRTASVGNLFCEVNESFKAYKVGEHRHTPEIEEALKSFSGSEIAVTFTPHLAPMNRGILSTITANLINGSSTKDILYLMREYYKDEPFVRICPEGNYPDVSDVRGSNYCDIGARVDKRTGHIVVISALDNLVKGAAGQAVQNMNIMSGMSEDEGLRHIPLTI